MSEQSRQLLTPDRLIRLHELSADELELLLLGFLRSRPLLTVNRGGKAVYDATCMVCHTTGVAGSPKIGDKAAWAPRLQAGMETLYANALKGKNAMPPKGGNMTLTDADVKSAVDFMISQSK